MQRVFLWFSALLALYVSGFACATEPPLPPGDEKPAPHIALLLPLKSATFGPAADAVQQGFLAAAGVEITNPQSLPVRVYGCFDEGNDIVTMYRRAIANGARAVVGPLTRKGVNTLAAEKDLIVPTLALNVADQAAAPQLYFFGMAVEAEAREIANLAKRQNLHQVIVITTHTQLAKRLQFAFEEKWVTDGGAILREIEFNSDPVVFADVAVKPDTLVFLAADAATARQIRPYLPNRLPIYATSQIFVGNTETLINYDLDGIRFVDMPWLLEPDHAAVMSYPRAAPPLPADHERFYALGIDAFRLVQLLIAKKAEISMPLDGVSGHIDLDGHTFLRTAIPAVFVQGHAQLPDAPVVPIAPMFPGLVPTSAVPEAAPPQ
ncbi:hypothetical protein FGKAn22_23950 [Ferrigenium kumadai]|uniref:Penicillin-binding protein activator n=2 Tax=Ferrigenium kumadai TaxID=1682490 RepID=A0AAN1T1C0_9PROT|nr:hypothetical protein FGKAn22_23950 [Ferrigenium kumadai]